MGNVLWKTRWLVVAVGLLTAGGTGAQAPKCNSQRFSKTSFGLSEGCYPCYPNVKCAFAQEFYCGNQAPASGEHCAAQDTFGGCACANDCHAWWPLTDPATFVCPFPSDTSANCSHLGSAEERCGADGKGDGVDDNDDGCIDEGCLAGKGQCTCVRSCSSTSCNPAKNGVCNPFNGQREICGDGEDNNCNGLIDEGCTPKLSCQEKAGADPIMLASGAAATEPFTDFSVEFVSTLAMTRSYHSADASVVGTGPHGIFGLGWHHQWEDALRCQGDVCTVSRGLLPGSQFIQSGSAPSLDGSETWTIYAPYDVDVLKGDSHDVLVRRPDGTWLLFLTDGSTLAFATVCDSCGAGDEPMCKGAEEGGIARLVRTVDPRGNALDVHYDRPGGLLLGLYDDLGHSLEARGTGACATGLASELVFDGNVVARYWYDGNELQRIEDAEGKLLRSYLYVPSSNGLIQAVKNEAGDVVAEFSYDQYGRAIGLVDYASAVSVDYDNSNGIAVTEYFQGASGATSSTSLRTLDQDGRATSISDGCACGVAQTREWTGHRLTCSMDVSGHVTHIDHDSLGRPTRTVEFQGTSCSIPSSLPQPARDERRSYGLTREIAQGVTIDLDLATSVMRPSTVDGSTLVGDTYDYDQSPNSAIDPQGYACTAIPLPAGAVVCRSITSGFAYIDASRGMKMERHATFFSYDARGRLVRTYGPVNLDYPNAGDVAPVEERAYWADAEGSARRGRLHEVRSYPSPDVAPLVTFYDYDEFGVFQVADPRGGVTTTVKDGRGRTRFVITSVGATESRYHDGLSPRVQIQPDGSAVRFTYDGRGRQLSRESLSSDPDAPSPPAVLRWTESYAYDEAGNRVHTERRDASGTVTIRQDRAYDVQHRVVRDAHPADPSRASTFAYDASGFLSGSQDEEGRTAWYRPDALGRVESVERSGLTPEGLAIRSRPGAYQYQLYQDAAAAVTDGGGTVTRYVHDDFGRLAELRSSTLNVDDKLSFTYDARGNLLERRSAHMVARYAYDGLDRVRSVTADDLWDGRSTQYGYVYDEPEGAGLLTSTTEPGRVVRYDHDAVGRVTKETVQEDGIPAPLVTQYTYHLDGGVDTITYPSGLAAKYTRDAATGEIGRVATADGSQVLADTIAWWPGGPARSFVFGNGQPFSQVLNQRQEPLSIRSGPLALSYLMNPAGDVMRIQDGDTSYRYEYDYLDRLIGFRPGYGAGSELTHHYVYSRMTESGTPTASGFVPRFAYGYDWQSNVSRIGQYGGTSITKSICLRHDPLGRLVLVGYASNQRGDQVTCAKDADATLPIARFRYDAQGRRIARWLASTGAWSYSVFGPSGELLAEVAPDAASAGWRGIREYVWLGGRPLAQIEHVGSATRPYYFHLDHIGLPRALTAPDGTTVWAAVPKPYGEVDETTTPDPATGQTVVTNLRLPGQYDERLLGPLGLQGPYYNWNRWYLPGVGRYLEPDPLALEGEFNSEFGVDWYGYANENPMRWIDPWGLYSCTYSISTHRMQCTPSDPTHPTFDSDHYVAGNNQDPTCPDCQNNPNRVNVPSHGPVPPGQYNVGQRTTPGGHRRRLTPDPNPRNGFQTHGCSNPATCSEGCIAATDNATRDQFDQLMDLEQNNTVQVVP